VAAFALLGFVVMGYHPGVEDDGVYLSAVKADLQPDLYPHDAEFFKLQMQATVFDRCMADFVGVTQIPVAWAELLWQFLILYLTLWASHSIAARLFADARAQWAGVALLAAMFTLPVAGTALCIADQHLHPRGVVTALILIAVSEVLTRRGWRAAVLLIGALVMHPIMAAFGISFCVILAGVGSRRWRADAAGTHGLWQSIEGPAGAKAQPDTASVLPGINPRSTCSSRPDAWSCVIWALKVRRDAFSCVSAILLVAVPMGWMFDRPSESWRLALESKSYFFLSRWEWYEWLGAIAPLMLFGLLAMWARRRGDLPLARFATAVTVYGVFQQVVALVMLGAPALVRLTPLQPMRFLHLVYVFMVLMGGCLLGRYVLRARVWRWAAFLVVVSGGMFVAQRVEFAHSPHWEMPGLRVEVSHVSNNGRHGAPSVVVGKVSTTPKVRSEVSLVSGSRPGAPSGSVLNGERTTASATAGPSTTLRSAQDDRVSEGFAIVLGRRNAWVEAFEWVRVNTPRDAYFALDPHYLEAPGEDFHSFRALAERSQMADAVKDAAVVTQVPRLGPAWKRQVEALAGWKDFKASDFERLKAEFGVDWMLASYPDPNPEPNLEPNGLKCPWHNDVVVICRIP